jgi:hypothetical protein
MAAPATRMLMPGLESSCMTKAGDSRSTSDMATQQIADAGRECEEEEEMILERLVAIKALRQETRRLEREYHSAGACDITIPAGWLDLLGRGLEWAIAHTEIRRDKGGLSDDELRGQIERVEQLAAVVRDVASSGAFSVGPEHHKALFAGLATARELQDAEVARLSDYDPLGQRFIAAHSEDALSSLAWLLWGRVGW